jgi:hypothetical protein
MKKSLLLGLDVHKEPQSAAGGGPSIRAEIRLGAAPGRRRDL